MSARGGAFDHARKETLKGLDMGKARKRKRLGSAQRYVLSMITETGFWNEMSGWSYDSAHQTNTILSTLSKHGWVKQTGHRARYGHFEITTAGAEKVAQLASERAEAARQIAEAEGSAEAKAKADSIYRYFGLHAL